MLIKLAARNILRQKVRTVMTLIAIVFGVSGLIISGGFVKDIFIQLGEAIIHSQTGHFQVFQSGYIEEGTRFPERYLIPEVEKTAKALRQLPGISKVASRLSFSGLLSNGRRDTPIIGEGMDLENLASSSVYVSYVQGRALDSEDRYGVTIGQGVAASMNLKPGDHVNVLINTSQGALNTLEFTVVGIFQSFSKEFDARAIRITLEAAQELFQTTGANSLIVSLDNTEDTDAAHAAIASALPSGLEVLSWRQLSDFYDKTVKLYDRQFGVLELIILAMVLLSVINSVNMSVFERQSEFGTMQAVGNRSRDVFRLIVVENVLLGLVGAVAGVVIGILFALGISSVGIPMPPPPNANLGYIAQIRIDAATVASAFLVGFVATSLASVLPARRVAATPVVDALRQAV